VLGATVIRSFNSTGMGAKVPGTDTYCYRERKFQGAKVRGRESSTYGTFALGSESLWERKLHNSFSPYDCPLITTSVDDSHSSLVTAPAV